MRNGYFGVAAAFAFGISLVAKAGPVTIDLTQANTQVWVNNALFDNNEVVQPAGTGVFQPFLTIQDQGNKNLTEGYNVPDGNFQLDQTRSHWNTGLKLSDMATFSINGTDYYRFLGDINEPSAGNKSLLSLNSLKFYLANTATPQLAPKLVPADKHDQIFEFDGFAPGETTPVLWDLDGGGVDRTITLDADLQSSGSGRSDLAFYIPTDVFKNQSFQYLIMYVAVGMPNTEDGGFEEFSFTPMVNHLPSPGPGDSTPLPSAACSGLLLLGGLAAKRGSRKGAQNA